MLTPKQVKFCAEYAVDSNGTRAAIAAGYSQRSAKQIASELLGKPAVKAEIQRLRDAALKKVGVKLEDVVAELAKIGFSDIRKLIDWTSGKTVYVLQDDEGPGGRMIDPDTEEDYYRTVTELALKDSSQIDDATAAAIAEISKTDSGTLKVKMHPKRAALADLLRHLGAKVQPGKGKDAGAGDRPGAPPPPHDDWADDLGHNTTRQ